MSSVDRRPAGPRRADRSRPRGGRLALLLLAGSLPACTRAPPAATARPRDDAAPAPLARAARDASAAAMAPDSRDPDLAFRTYATGTAVRLGCTVAAWGTAHLEETAATTDRVATLVPSGDGPSGAYLIEESAGHRWLLTFAYDGRTRAWHAADTDAGLAWSAWTERALAHRQTRRDGYDAVDVALRGHQPVTLRTESLADARTHAPPVAHEYAVDGQCSPACPPVPTDADDAAASLLRSSSTLRPASAM